ncbi:hypothetical protein H312_01518, partial [Anncaliia algerae PRA339]
LFKKKQLMGLEPDYISGESLKTNVLGFFSN